MKMKVIQASEILESCTHKHVRLLSVIRSLMTLSIKNLRWVKRVSMPHSWWTAEINYLQLLKTCIRSLYLSLKGSTSSKNKLRTIEQIAAMQGHHHSSQVQTFKGQAHKFCCLTQNQKLNTYAVSFNFTK